MMSNFVRLRGGESVTLIEFVLTQSPLSCIVYKSAPKSRESRTSTSVPPIAKNPREVPNSTSRHIHLSILSIGVVSYLGLMEERSSIAAYLDEQLLPLGHQGARHPSGISLLHFRHTKPTYRLENPLLQFA